MKNKTLALTISSIVLGAGVAFATTAVASHGHTGNTTAAGGDMMGTTPHTYQHTQGGHMGDVNTGNKNAPATLAANHHDGMHSTGNTQNHMTGDTTNSMHQYHGITDHHDSKPSN